MAFMSGVLGNVAGQAQGAQAAYQDRLKQAAEQSDRDLQQKQFDIENKREADSAAHIAAQDADLASKDKVAERNAGIGLDLPPPKYGADSKTLRALANQYLAAGATKQAADIEKMAKDQEQAEHEGRVDAIRLKVATDALTKTMAQIKHWGAQDTNAAKAIAQRMQVAVATGSMRMEEAQARINGALEEGRQRDVAEMQRALMTQFGSNNRAAYDAQVKIELAKINGQYSAAKDQFNAQLQEYKSQNTPAAQLLRSSDPNAAPPMPMPTYAPPNINVTVPTSLPASGMTPEQEAFMMAMLQRMGGTSPNGAVPNANRNKVKPPSVDPVIDDYVSKIRAAQRANVRPEEILAKLNSLPGLTPQQKAAIMAKAGLSSTAPSVKPPPIGATIPGTALPAWAQ